MRKSVGGKKHATAAIFEDCRSTESRAVKLPGAEAQPCMSERCPPADAPAIPIRSGSM